MTSIVKVPHAAIAEGKEPKEEIFKFLGIYKNTKHPTTGKSPSSLLMKRKTRLRIPAVMKDTNQDYVKEEVKSRVTEIKAKQKIYADKHREVKKGDEVIFKQTKTTIKPPYDPKPYKSDRGKRKKTKSF